MAAAASERPGVRAATHARREEVGSSELASEHVNERASALADKEMRTQEEQETRRERESNRYREQDSRRVRADERHSGKAGNQESAEERRRTRIRNQG